MVSSGASKRKRPSAAIAGPPEELSPKKQCLSELFNSQNPIKTPDTSIVNITLICDRFPQYNETFSIYYASIARHSPTLAGLALPSSEKTYSLEFPNADYTSQNTITLFINWLYLGKLPTIDSSPMAFYFLKLWVFGSKYKIPELQNDVIKQLVTFYSRKDFELSTLWALSGMIYGGKSYTWRDLRSMEEDKDIDIKPLKKLAVKTAFRYMTSGMFTTNDMDGMPSEMMKDFTLALMKFYKKQAVGTRPGDDELFKAELFFTPTVVASEAPAS